MKIVTIALAIAVALAPSAEAQPMGGSFDFTQPVPNPGAERGPGHMPRDDGMSAYFARCSAAFSALSNAAEMQLGEARLSGAELLRVATVLARLSQFQAAEGANTAIDIRAQTEALRSGRQVNDRQVIEFAANCLRTSYTYGHRYIQASR